VFLDTLIVGLGTAWGYTWSCYSMEHKWR